MRPISSCTCNKKKCYCLNFRKIQNHLTIKWPDEFLEGRDALVLRSCLGIRLVRNYTLRIVSFWVYIRGSSLSLVVPFASSEPSKTSTPLTKKLVAGNRLRNKVLYVAYWPWGYSQWIPCHTLQSRENLDCSLVRCNLHFLFVLCILNQVCIHASIMKNEQHRMLSFSWRSIQG